MPGQQRSASGGRDSRRHDLDGVIAIAKGNRQLLTRRALMPSDQQKTLDKQDSWASNLQRHPHSSANVPNGVLSALRDFHARAHRQPPTRATTVSNGGGSQVNGADPPASPRSVDTGMESESEGVPISWPASPELSPAPIEAIRQADSREASPTPAKEPMPSFSTTQDEEEMDLELPGAATVALCSVNKNAAPAVHHLATPLQQLTSCNDTPPNGQGTQIIIPSTFATPPCAQPERRPRKMKMVKFPSEDNLSNTTNRAMSPPITRLPQTRLPIPPKSTASSSSASSVVPSSEPLVQNTQVAAADEPGDGVFFLSQEEPSRIEDTMASPPLATARLDSKVSQDMDYRIEETKIVLSSAVKPRLYDAFLSAYPAYRANLNMFLQACYTLKMLRRKRAFSSFLYDDFIRAYGTDYSRYVLKLSEDATASPAVEWYNDNVEEPLFTSNMITRQNLDEVLDTYSDELARVKELIVDSQSTNGDDGEMAVDTSSKHETIPSTALTSESRFLRPHQKEVQPRRYVSAGHDRSRPTGKPSFMCDAAALSEARETVRRASAPAGRVKGASSSSTAAPSSTFSYLQRLSSSSRVSKPVSSGQQNNTDRARRLLEYLKRKTAEGTVSSSGRSRAA